MTELTFTRRGLEDHRRWLGISDHFRETLQVRYPTREAAIEAMEYGDYVARRDAIRVLGALGDLDAVLHYALVERESSWIPTLACEIFVQPPLEILVAWITKMKPSGDGSRISEVVSTVLPRFNFGHVGQELVDFLASQKQKLKSLSPDNLKSLGLSAVPQVARLLEPHAALDQLRTYAQALEAGVARKACRPSWFESMLGEEQRSLDRASTAAINATVALRRLGQRVDTVRVEDWLRQLEQLFSVQDLGRYPASEYVMELRWVLFDAGDDSQLDAMLSENALRVRHDVAMSLLLRGDHGNLERWRQSLPADLIHPPFQVHYWPLIDYLQSEGLRHMSADDACHALARAASAPAPHGWVWRCVPED